MSQQTDNNRSQAMLDWQLARALFSANIPFESIEHPLMIDFFKRLQPNYVVPKGKRLLQYLLKEQHWDLIQWDDNRQQQRLSPGRMINNTTTTTTTTTNRLLSSLHSPTTDLDGSL
ncbi:uncharacterized protein BX663DRAFT_503548 [Cokeromyces recurvatus]|uniref:uncharacterized protein n=1 Tax=Cokeromyces recurvatus TaxID=90255 RepID=UPI00221F8620|nr:uncharacterized protein BX663DRAFT_503548 [Cokeromyces recurvatus]KAI7904793.1 hypothetical protein BX663DRAFT_503548 [Cokeromyces recurvatus]